MSDILLLKKIIEGEEDSGLLYNNYVKNMYSYGISLGFSRDTCMDAIHDVFCKLYQLKQEDILGIKNVKHFLFTSLKNRLFDIYKKNRNLEALTGMESMPFEMEVSILDAMIDEEDRALIIKKVELLISCLTDRQKEAVYLRYIQEMDYEEISTLLNMTPKSARMLVFRAMEKMRAFSEEINDKKCRQILTLIVILFRYDL